MHEEKKIRVCFWGNLKETENLKNSSVCICVCVCVCVMKDNIRIDMKEVRENGLYCIRMVQDN